MNVIALTGNATKDIELRYSPSGTGIATGTIAVRRDFKNKDGEYETDFINFVAIGKVSEIMTNHIHKGDKFGITGRLQIRQWVKDNGDKQYFTEVVVNGFDFPQKSQGNQQRQPQQQSPQPNTRIDDDPFTGGSIHISDDSLPF